MRPARAGTAVSLVIAIALLAAAWLGPLPRFARESFAAHMTLHMTIVAIVAPLLALAIAGTRLDPARTVPSLFAPIPASLLELVAVWAWHAPALHHAARTDGRAFVFEQATFLVAGLVLWLAAVGGDVAVRPARRAAGIFALLFTAMHMTLLGVLLALSPRALYAHAGPGALDDQHLGGVLMLLLGGVSYLAGGLWLTAGVVRAGSRAVAAGKAT
jgi:putative membrane protein